MNLQVVLYLHMHIVCVWVFSFVYMYMHLFASLFLHMQILVRSYNFRPGTDGAWSFGFMLQVWGLGFGL